MVGFNTNYNSNKNHINQTNNLNPSNIDRNISEGNRKSDNLKRKIPSNTNSSAESLSNKKVFTLSNFRNRIGLLFSRYFPPKDINKNSLQINNSDRNYQKHVADMKMLRKELEVSGVVSKSKYGIDTAIEKLKIYIDQTKEDPSAKKERDTAIENLNYLKQLVQTEDSIMTKEKAISLIRDSLTDNIPEIKSVLIKNKEERNIRLSNNNEILQRIENKLKEKYDDLTNHHEYKELITKRDELKNKIKSEQHQENKDILNKQLTEITKEIQTKEDSVFKSQSYKNLQDQRRQLQAEIDNIKHEYDMKLVHDLSNHPSFIEVFSSARNFNPQFFEEFVHRIDVLTQELYGNSNIENTQFILNTAIESIYQNNPKDYEILKDQLTSFDSSKAHNDPLTAYKALSKNAFESISQM